VKGNMERKIYNKINANQERKEGLVLIKAAEIFTLERKFLWPLHIL
jgi:hypothetical protein